MTETIIERQMEGALQGWFGNDAGYIVKGISKLAAKQGGASTIENYQLLAKRALIVLGVAAVTVQAVSSVVGFVISRRSEEKRMERVARRVVEEERQKEKAQA